MTEELKQRLNSTSVKITRYEARTEHYLQNRMFQTNQAMFGIWDWPAWPNNKTQLLRRVETQLRGVKKRKHYYKQII